MEERTEGESLKNKGMFITFEGGDGSGKTSNIKALAEHLESLELTVFLTHEPGGPEISEKIRELLHDLKYQGIIDHRTEFLLYQAARAQHVAQWIKPWLREGGIVLCDRFYDSTMAYQAFGRGILPDFVRSVSLFAAAQLVPDLTILLDVDAEIGLERRMASGVKLNRLDVEELEFHERVNRGYKEMALNDEGGRWEIINANKPLEVVQKNLRFIVEARLTAAGFIERNTRQKERLS